MKTNLKLALSGILAMGMLSACGQRPGAQICSADKDPFVKAEEKLVELKCLTRTTLNGEQVINISCPGLEVKTTKEIETIKDALEAWERPALSTLKTVA